ncbi:Uncharacterised protein [uncultured archaeon]|nr:Uncharacterised protein [uncultured archaeon]
MEQMIEISGVLMSSLMDMPEKEAKEKAKITIPKLKRWQKSEISNPFIVMNFAPLLRQFHDPPDNNFHAK